MVTTLHRSVLDNKITRMVFNLNKKMFLFFFSVKRFIVIRKVISYL